MQINFSNQFIHPTRFFFSPETTNNRSQVYAFMQIYYNACDMQKEKKLLAYYSILYIITHFEEWNIFLIIKISNIKTSIIHKYLYDIRRIEKNIPSSIFFLITYKSNLLNNKNSLVQDFFIHQSHFSFFLFHFHFPISSRSSKKSLAIFLPSNESLPEKRSSTRSFVRVYLRSTIWREARAREGRPGRSVCMRACKSACVVVPFEGVNAYGGGFLSSLSRFRLFPRFDPPTSRPLVPATLPSFLLSSSSRSSVVLRARAATGLFWFTECRVCRARASCVC